MIRPISFPMAYKSVAPTGNRSVIQPLQADQVLFSGKKAKSSLSDDQTALMKGIAKLNALKLTAKNKPTNPQDLQKFFFAQAQAYFDASVKDTYESQLQSEVEDGADPATVISDSIGDYSQENVDAFKFALGKAIYGKEKFVYTEDLAEWLGLSEDETSDKLYATHSTACDNLVASLG